MAKSRIEYTDAPADVMKRLVAGTRKGVEAAAQHWDDQFLEEHFEDDAPERYAPNYSKRSGEGEPAYVPSVRGIVLAGGRTKYGSARVKANPRYFHRKAREGYGKTPLVRSGELKRQALAGGKVSSRAKGATVEATDSISVPKYTHTRPINSKVDKPREMTAVTGGELATLGRVIETTAAKAAQSGGRRRTVRK